MRKRTYHPYRSADMNDAMNAVGTYQNGCAVVAVAYALADEPGETAPAEEWVPSVTEALRASGQYTRSGSWRGGMAKALRLVGIGSDHEREEYQWVDATRPGYKWDRDYQREHGGYDGYSTYDKRQYPTVARWLRENPTVKRAIIHTVGHASYIGPAEVHGTSARRRVQSAEIIERW